MSWGFPAVKPDPKPAKRIRNREAYRAFHARGHDCLSCGHGRFIQAHHILSPAQAGDDVLANLVPLCVECHGAFHGKPYRAFGVKIDAAHVKRAIGTFVLSEAGVDAAMYLTVKLGVDGSVAFVEAMGVSVE